MFENKPITIKPSLSIICNRSCGFCGIKRVDFSDLFDRKIKTFMSTDLAEQMAKEIGSWIPSGVRFELGGFGEPLLNKDADKIIEIIRRYNPKSQIMMYTNTSVLNGDIINNVFDNGLNILYIDCYTKEDLDGAIDLLFNHEYNGIYLKTQKFNPYKKGDVKGKSVCIQDYSEAEHGGYNERSNQKHLHNAAGNIDDIAYETYDIQRIFKPLDKMCTRPFRELVILPDGIVPLCCLDWCRDLILGKFPEESLQSIWYGELSSRIRAHLYSRSRNFYPCCQCNNTSKMIGLVPKPTVENNFTKLMRARIVKNEQFKRFKLKKVENIKFKGNVRNW